MAPLFLSAAVVLFGTACSADGPADSLPDLPTRFQAALDDWTRNPDHYGVSASVILADGTQWSGAAGRAGDGALRPEHLIAIASITKTMTGAVILQLVGEGRLSLDDPISRWLPSRANIDPAITVRQLLNHTNGLANYTASAALGAALADPARQFTLDELLGYVGPPVFPRGTRTQYTNTSFLLLGEVAERVTGTPIPRLYAERLWGPAGLGEVFLPGASDPPGPVAPSLTRNGDVILPTTRPSFFSMAHSAFGLMATARDVARWGRALFTGTVLTPAIQAEMRILVPAAGNIPGESGAGLGIRSYGYLGRTQYGHSGGAPYGSSLLLFDPNSGVTVAVIMNQGAGADHFTLAPALLEIAAQP